MEQRRFGDSDLVCSALGFGTWEMSTTEYGEIDVDEASKAVNEAIDRGITLIDTAEAYGPHHSEEILGRTLGPRRKEVVLVTKVGLIRDYVVEGRNGMFFKKRDAYHLSQKILELLKDDPKRERMGAAARKTVREMYSFDKTVKDVRQSLELL